MNSFPTAKLEDKSELRGKGERLNVTQILKTGKYHLGNIIRYSLDLAASGGLFRPIKSKKKLNDYKACII